MPKAMKARRWTVTQEVSFVTTLTDKQVDGVIDALFDVACAELKKNGNFNFINMVRLKVKPATAAKEGFHPITKAPIMIKAKRPSIRGYTMRKFKLALADELECRWIRFPKFSKSLAADAASGATKSCDAASRDGGWEDG